ncbi:hypothetical protein Ancab_033099 [Ancistrocladus abbreviatus]
MKINPSRPSPPLVPPPPPPPPSQPVLSTRPSPPPTPPPPPPPAPTTTQQRLLLQDHVLHSHHLHLYLKPKIEGVAPSPPPLLAPKGGSAPPTLPQSSGRGKATSEVTNNGRGRPASSVTSAPKRTSLKPLHWVKVTRAMQGSLWADTQKQENQSGAPEIDITELESLFSAGSDGSGHGKAGVRRGANISKPEKVQLVLCGKFCPKFHLLGGPFRSRKIPLP